MTLNHVTKINGRVYTIEKATDIALVLGSGKRYAVAFLESKKLVHRHCLTGRFMSTKIK